MDPIRLPLLFLTTDVSESDEGIDSELLRAWHEIAVHDQGEPITRFLEEPAESITDSLRSVVTGIRSSAYSPGWRNTGSWRTRILLTPSLQGRHSDYVVLGPSGEPQRSGHLSREVQGADEREILAAAIAMWRDVARLASEAADTAKAVADDLTKSRE